MGEFVWTDARIDRMADMRAKNVSYAAIAAVLGVSRNSALGKAGRLRQAGDDRLSSRTIRERPRPACLTQQSEQSRRYA